MEFVTSNLNISNLKRKMDIRGLTLQIAAHNILGEGRFYMLWKDGNFITIQAEPWWRPDFVPDGTPRLSHYLEEYRALWHLQEVIQTMLDMVILDGNNNWAYLVRLKNGAYRLVHAKRQLIRDCPIWTKAVELDDIEITRFATGQCWEGTYKGEKVDILVAWKDLWGTYISDESRAQKLVESRGVGRYFPELKAHVYKNGVLVGIMMETLVGRGVTLSDRPAVFTAIADIQRQGIFFWADFSDIYITERGVRFASASTARYYQDRDALAQDASILWETLIKAFNNLVGHFPTDQLQGSRIVCSSAVIIPRLPSPGRPITLTAEEGVFRWLWSANMSENRIRSGGASFSKLHGIYHGNSNDLDQRGNNRARLSPEEFSGDINKISIGRDESPDGPLVARHRTLVWYHPYTRPSSRRLLLPPECDTALFAT